MVKQDQRVIDAGVDQLTINGFFEAIAVNDNSLIQEFLQLEPTLIYARDLDTGNTAMVCLLLNPNIKEVQTLTVILDTMASQGLAPDFTLTNNHNTNARDAYNSIGNPRIQAQMNQILLNHGFNILDVAPAPTAAYTPERLAEMREREDAYFDKNKKKAEMIKRIEDGAKIKTSKKDDESSGGGGKGGEKCVVSMAFIDDEPYMNTLMQQLEKLPPLSMDQKKKIEQELYNPLEGISFAPVVFGSGSGELSIVVIPKELAEFSLEQIKGFIGMIYSYFSDAETS